MSEKMRGKAEEGRRGGRERRGSRRERELRMREGQRGGGGRETRGQSVGMRPARGRCYIVTCVCVRVFGPIVK